jgi:hypothetical protein
LKLSFKQRQLMDTCWESSLLASPEEQEDKSELLVTLRTHKRRLFVKRWWKLWSLKPKNLPWRSWPRNCKEKNFFIKYNYIYIFHIAFKRTLENKLPRSAVRFSLSKTSWSRSSSSSRSLSSILPNLWSSTKRDQSRRREEKRKEKKAKKKSHRTSWLQRNEVLSKTQILLNEISEFH